MVGNTSSRKKLIKKYTQEKLNGGEVVDRGWLEYVLLERGMIKRLKAVHMFRDEAASIFNNFLVEGILKVEQ